MRNVNNYGILSSVLVGGQVQLQERDLHFNLMGDKSQKWRIIGYIVVKCHSHFLVSQHSSAQGGSEE